jgi:hypothetical protein
MVTFAIVEVEDGWMVVPIEAGQTAEDAAVNAHGVLVDAGPYASWQDATDALEELAAEEEEIPAQECVIRRT